MNKNKYLAVVLFSFFFIPSVALASWWNPFSWFDNWSFNKKIIVPQVQVEVPKTSEEKNNELKNQQPISTTPPAVKEVKKNVPVIDNSAIIREQVRIQTEATLKAKAEQDALIAKQKAEEQAKIDALKEAVRDEIERQEEEKAQKQIDELKDELEEINEKIDSLNAKEEPEEIIKESQARMEITTLGNYPLSYKSYGICATIDVGVALFDYNGDIDQESGATLLAPNQEQNTYDDYANTKSGLHSPHLYALRYYPHEAGEHILVIQSGGFEETVTITVENEVRGICY